MLLSGASFYLGCLLLSRMLASFSGACFNLGCLLLSLLLASTSGACFYLECFREHLWSLPSLLLFLSSLCSFFHLPRGLQCEIMRLGGRCCFCNAIASVALLSHASEAKEGKSVELFIHQEPSESFICQVARTRVNILCCFPALASRISILS